MRDRAGLPKQAVPPDPSVRLCCITIADGSPLASAQPDTPLYPASTLKLAVLIAAYRAVDDGGLGLDQRLTVVDRWTGLDGGQITMQEDDVDPVLRTRTGQTATVTELIERMITVSSNEATNILIDRLGTGTINAVIAQLGAGGTSLHHHLGDRAAWGTANANVSTAADLARIVRAIAAGSAASPRSNTAMLELLGRQQHRELIPAALPEDVECLNKPGDADGVVHDVAIVRGAGFPPYALAVCACDYPTPELAQAAVRERAAEAHRLVTGNVTVI